jgi:superfamily II DNA or RNA helicase
MSNTPDIVVFYNNDVHAKISCREPSIGMEMVDYFTFTVPNARYTPAYRHKIWDGKIRLYNQYNELLYCGLMPYVIKFAEERNYTLKFNDDFVSTNFNNYSKEDTVDFLNSLNIHSRNAKLTPLPHQIEGVNYATNNNRCLLLSPTASGKSYIIYALVRHYQTKIKNKILIVVPTVSLVYQMLNDFKDYSSAVEWDIQTECHGVFSGQNKDTDRQIVVSTWQSIYKLSKKYFEQFECVIVDESHHMRSDSIKGIMEKLTKCPYRIGLTGTLDGMKTNKLVVEGLTGKVHRIAYTKDLIDANILSKLKIECITLKYTDDERKSNKNLKYDEEIKYLISHDRRNNFISDLALNLKGNTLILYQFVEKHGKLLHDLISSKNKDNNRKIYFVSGDIEADVRESMRKAVENENNAIIVASYGTFSTGINIRKLHNVIFASPSKGRVRVLQSIGRQLRKSDSKECAKLYDISDDMSWKSHQNYSLKHFMERLKIYSEEKFDYKTVSIKL